MVQVSTCIQILFRECYFILYTKHIVVVATSEYKGVVRLYVRRDAHGPSIYMYQDSIS